MTTKFKQEHMPLVQLARPGVSLDGQPRSCDYCTAGAVWYHWADQWAHRDAYACDTHVGFLNRYYR